MPIVGQEGQFISLSFTFTRNEEMIPPVRGVSLRILLEFKEKITGTQRGSDTSQALLSTHCTASYSDFPNPVIISMLERGKQGSEKSNTLSDC